MAEMDNVIAQTVAACDLLRLVNLPGERFQICLDRIGQKLSIGVTGIHRADGSHCAAARHMSRKPGE